MLAYNSNDRACAVFVAQEGSDIYGFLSVGRQRDPELITQGFMGEFTSIYILGAYQRLGVGRALMSAGAHHLISEGIESAAVWVLKENVKAYNFYSALGAEDLTARDDFDSGFVITDVALGWKSIVCLL